MISPLPLRNRRRRRRSASRNERTTRPAALPCKTLRSAAAVVAFFSGACQEQLPTSAREQLIPSGLVVDVTLSFDEFGSNLRVYGGFGRTSDRGGGFVAHEFGADAGPGGSGLQGLQAATLARFGDYPSSASVRDTTGTTRPDSSLTFLSGRIFVVLDTVGSVASGPVSLVAHEVVDPWDRRTATWDLAVDTAGARIPWSEAGGGPPQEIGRVVWEPGKGDSVFIAVDSARLYAWADTARDFHGIRLEADAAGSRLELRSLGLLLKTLPSLAPDTLLDLAVPVRSSTFVYDPPAPAPSSGEARVGGVPAWRSVLDVAIPGELNGPPSLCAEVACPVLLEERHVSYAGLQLFSRVPARPYAPSDTLSIEVRRVLAPAFLPKSPLGPSLTGLGERLAPEWFAPPAGEVVEIPVTSLVRDLLRDEASDGGRASSAVALLSTLEPLSLEYVSFEKQDPARRPRLRLILSFSRDGR